MRETWLQWLHTKWEASRRVREWVRALFSLADTATDALVLWAWWASGDIVWFSVGVGFLVLAQFVMAVTAFQHASTRLLEQKSCFSRILLFVACIFGVGPLAALFMSYDEEGIAEAQTLLGRLRLREAIFESAPQILLQSYILFGIQLIDPVVSLSPALLALQVTSIIVSLISASATVESMDAGSNTDWLMRNWIAYGLLSFFDLAARISRLLFFAASVGGWVFILLGGELLLWVSVDISSACAAGAGRMKWSATHTMSALSLPTMHSVAFLSMIKDSAKVRAKPAVALAGWCVGLLLDSVALSALMIFLPVIAFEKEENDNIRASGMCSQSEFYQEGWCFTETYVILVVALQLVHIIANTFGAGKCYVERVKANQSTGDSVYRQDMHSSVPIGIV